LAFGYTSIHTSPLSLHFHLASVPPPHFLQVVTNIERSEIEFISKTLNCLPVAHVDHLKPEKLGSADLVEEVEVGKGRVVKVTGIQNKGRTTTVLLRASNKLVLEEADRSLHDALCVLRCLVHKRFLITGGSSPETEVFYQLSQVSTRTEHSRKYSLFIIFGLVCVHSYEVILCVCVLAAKVCVVTTCYNVPFAHHCTFHSGLKLYWAWKVTVHEHLPKPSKWCPTHWQRMLD
jgi:hypothetical protein